MSWGTIYEIWPKLCGVLRFRPCKIWLGRKTDVVFVCRKRHSFFLFFFIRSLFSVFSPSAPSVVFKMEKQGKRIWFQLIARDLFSRVLRDRAVFVFHFYLEHTQEVVPFFLLFLVVSADFLLFLWGQNPSVQSASSTACSPNFHYFHSILWLCYFLFSPNSCGYHL